MEIKGLREKLGVSDEEFDKLRELRIATELRTAQLYMSIWRKGGNLHGVDEEATARRRKANKQARKQRRANRS
jgi:hypothetical protein